MGDVTSTFVMAAAVAHLGATLTRQPLTPTAVRAAIDAGGES